MSSIARVAKESTGKLGSSAALVNVLPSLSLVLVTCALITSKLYPWASPYRDAKGTEVAPGVDSVMHAVKGLNATGGAVLLLVVVVAAVMLRPFQVATVQLLEGYWTNRSLKLAETLLIERHARRLSVHRSRERLRPPRADNAEFSAVARAGRNAHRAESMERRAERITAQYPARVTDLMPTSLGNVLRRAESMAGERYGLNTVVTYTRLYPHLSNRLDQQMGMQLDIIDTMAAFTVVFIAQSLVAAALLARLDWWSMIPLAFGAFSAIAYRGARLAAEHNADQLATAYDLHRFDMLAAMHRMLPTNAFDEYRENEKLSSFLAGIAPIPENERSRWRYSHPAPGATNTQASGGASDKPPGDGGSVPAS